MRRFSRRLAPLPAPHAAISVAAEITRWGYYIEYRGPTLAALLAALLAAGCISQGMVNRLQHPNKGRSRVDEEGDGFRRVKRPLKDQPGRVDVIRCVHTKDKPGGKEKALALPGVREYLEAHPPEPEKPESNLPWHMQAADVAARQMNTTGIMSRSRLVGRFRRAVDWATVGGVLLIPDWVSIKAHVIVGRGAQ